MRSVMKPGAKSRFDADLGTRPGTGQLCSSAQQFPELVRITGLDQLPGLLAGDTRFGAPDTFG